MSKKFILKRNHEKYIRPEIREISKESENKIKHNEDNMNEKVEKVEKIMDISNNRIPKRKVKIEKKEKGLIERTEDSTILITEDNKLMLND